jgi:hypothetical protein
MRRVVGYDINNTVDWSYYQNTYNAAEHLIQSLIRYDDGSVHIV